MITISSINNKGISIDSNFLSRMKKNNKTIVKVKIDNKKEIVGFSYYFENEKLEDMKKLESVKNYMRELGRSEEFKAKNLFGEREKICG